MIALFFLSLGLNVVLGVLVCLFYSRSNAYKIAYTSERSKLLQLVLVLSAVYAFKFASGLIQPKKR